MSEIRHGSAAAFEDAGVLVLGGTGSGKSTLILQLIGQGATLVADDRVALQRREGRIWMSSPEPLEGLLEARGLGVLRVSWKPAPLVVAIDLDEVETDRMPLSRSLTILGVNVPLLRKVESPAFATMLRFYSSGGRVE